MALRPDRVCDQLNEATAPFELVFGPRPATHSRCGFGGMLGNNSCGAYAQMAGKAIDNTEEMEVLLYDGTIMSVGWMTDGDLDEAIRGLGRAAEVYRRIKALRTRWGDAMRNRLPKLPRRVSGYSLDQLLPGPDGSFNVARALVGSESTLVTILSAKVRLVSRRPQRVLVVLGYEDIYRAACSSRLGGMEQRARLHLRHVVTSATATCSRVRCGTGCTRRRFVPYESRRGLP
jgi:FAD/FMN-containing dehydrogenase